MATSFPTEMGLSSLPLELLGQIAACVRAVHRPSLFPFALASKACHRASTYLIFRDVNITAHNGEKLQRDVERIHGALLRTDSARSVQRVSIRGALQLNARKADRYDEDPDPLKSNGLEEILIEEEPISYSGPYVVYDEPVIQKSSDEDLAWAPVVSLLQAIPHLKDFIYDCKNQLAPSILSTLHHWHPNCRLHHLKFRMRTLLWGVPYPYEMELATSPSLYKIKISCSLRDSDGDDDFNLEAAMELVTLAPNLKEVIALHLSPQCSDRFYRVRDSWKSLPGYITGSMGSLTSLLLKGHCHFPSELQQWAKYTDFACLQHLTLGGSFSIASGLNDETMEHIARNYSFPKLRTLSVNLTRDDEFVERPYYSNAAASFFQAFEPLEELYIHGPLDTHILDAILDRHGQCLEKLTMRLFEYPGMPRNHIPMVFTKDQILQIQAQCPLLEELAVPVKRDKSSASEAEIYRCFGKMKRLRYLSLNLDCSNWRVCRDDTYDPQFEGEDQKIAYDRMPGTRGVWKETLINCAVDEMLARSIWETINQNKKGKRLECLKLWTTGGGEFGNGSGTTWLYSAVRILSRSWIIERIPRDDRDDITVRQVGERKDKFWDWGLERVYETEIGSIFSDIWPPKEGRKNWSSFPLQI